MTHSLGKLRRLQQCATAAGHFIIMAVDHRDNLRAALQEARPGETIADLDLVDFKLAVTAALRGTYSAALLDPEYGIAQAIHAGVMPGDCGAIVSVEKWGYSGDPKARETSVLDGWGVSQIVRLGGAGVKMLLYYHPDAPNAARQEQVAAEVAGTCREHEIPFFLEPIVYALRPEEEGLPTAVKRPLVLATVRRLSPYADILKAEFPVNIADEPDESIWLAACAQLDEASQVPWVLLSGGVGYEDFARQTRVACRAGCSGVMVGRAVWQEAVGLRGRAREAFLTDTAAGRLRRLAALVAANGRPWTAHPSFQQVPVAAGWYKSY